MTRVLVTGFEPFGGSDVNASAEAVRSLPSTTDGVEIVTAILPCVFAEAPRALAAAIARHRPDVVVAVGEAGGRTSIDLERVALNIDDARIADNAGSRPVDEPVIADAPLAYPSTLPIKACVASVEALGLRSSVSNTAGTFVCNHVFFSLMHQTRALQGVRAGFVHVPTIDVLETADTTRALEAVVRTASATVVDIVVSGGRES